MSDSVTAGMRFKSRKGGDLVEVVRLGKLCPDADGYDGFHIRYVHDAKGGVKAGDNAWWAKHIFAAHFART